MGKSLDHHSLLDLDAISDAVDRAGDDQIPVTTRWLRQALDELREGRKFLSPIAALTPKGDEHG